jgi:hypothetical protein
MKGTTMDHAPLTEHAPRPAGDPDYVPYWAKGEYARRNGTSYTTESGVTIVHGLATGRLPVASRPAPLSKLQPAPASVRETPRKAPATPPKPARTPDLVAQLLALHKTREARLGLCAKYGVDPAIFTGAPNPGVAAMRLANALRAKVLQ